MYKSIKSVQKVHLEGTLSKKKTYTHDGIKFGLRPNRHHQVKFGLNFDLRPGLRPNFGLRL